jgi:hypothetical protein
MNGIKQFQDRHEQQRQWVDYLLMNDNAVDN